MTICQGGDRGKKLIWCFGKKKEEYPSEFQHELDLARKSFHHSH